VLDEKNHSKNANSQEFWCRLFVDKNLAFSLHAASTQHIKITAI